MIKSKPIYSYIERNVMNSLGYKSLKKALSVPLRKGEEILTSFILDWLRIRWKVIEEDFDLAYNKGWLPQYKEIKDNNNSSLLKLFSIEYLEALTTVSSNYLYNPAKDKYKQIKHANNVISTSSFTEDEYKDVLYIFYCSYFYNTDIFNLKKYKTEKIFNWVKFIKIVVKKDCMYELRKNYLRDNGLEKYDKAMRMNYQAKYRTYKDIVMTNLTEDLFSETNIGQKYAYWKSYSEAAPDTLRRSLFYSLCVRLPQRTSITFYTRKRLVLRILYYWYYGIVEEHYVETIFDILHGEYGEGERNLMARLFSEKNESDKTALNYFKSRYAQYCLSRNISKDKQVPILKSFNEKDDTQDNQTIYSKAPSQLGEMPNGFTMNQLKILAKLLYDGDGEISLLKTNDCKNALPYFLGAPTTSKPPSKYKIYWKKDMKSLKYFITRLYDTKKMHGIWKTTSAIFLVLSKGKYREIKSVQSLSNLSSTGAQGYLNIDTRIKDFIDKCITEAKNMK